MIEVGEEVTREDATEEMQIAVGAEDVETSEKDFEVYMTTSEVAQDEESVDLDVKSGSQKSETAAEDVMVDMDTFSEETDNEEQFQLKIMEDSESANTVSNVQSTFEEADVEQGS